MVPTAQGKQGKWLEKNLCPNTGKCVCLVLNPLVLLKIKDIAIVAAKFPNLFLKTELHMNHPQITEIGTGKILQSDGEKTGKSQGI